MTARARVHQLLEVAEPGDKPSQIVDYALVILILLNVAAVTFESATSISQGLEVYFQAFEFFSVAIFSVEYVGRIWSAVDSSDPRYAHPVKGRLRYMVTPLALIDLVAILPFYLGFILALDLRILRALRLLRIFKLTRFSPAMTLLIDVLRQETDALCSAFFILMIILVFASGGIYVVEHTVQPEAFGSIPAAMWWAVATLTTVGYGDVTPVTPLGKIFGAAITIVGIGMVALPAGLLGSGFSEALRRRREQYERRVEKMLEDAAVTNEEDVALNELRAGLGIHKESARRIFESVLHRRRNVCPGCGKILPPSM